MNLAHIVSRAIVAQIPGSAVALARTKRERERELRAAGYSRSEAKRIVASEQQKGCRG